MSRRKPLKPLPQSSSNLFVRLSGQGKLGLFILAAGIVPTLIKRSKPLAQYLGEQLVRAGEYLQTDSEVPVSPEPAAPTPQECGAVVEEHESFLEPEGLANEEPSPSTEPEPELGRAAEFSESEVPPPAEPDGGTILP